MGTKKHRESLKKVGAAHLKVIQHGSYEQSFAGSNKSVSTLVIPIFLSIRSNLLDIDMLIQF